jgi:hypothetical protein
MRHVHGKHVQLCWLPQPNLDSPQHPWCPSNTLDHPAILQQGLTRSLAHSKHLRLNKTAWHKVQQVHHGQGFLLKTRPPAGVLHACSTRTPQGAPVYEQNSASSRQKGMVHGGTYKQSHKTYTQGARSAALVRQDSASTTTQHTLPTWWRAQALGQARMQHAAGVPDQAWLLPKALHARPNPAAPRCHQGLPSYKQSSLTAVCLLSPGGGLSWAEAEGCRRCLSSHLCQLKPTARGHMASSSSLRPLGRCPAPNE